MNQPFAHFLPWRVASLAGLLVGGLSLYQRVDVWDCLLRVGAAFFLFALLGLGLRATLQDKGPSDIVTGQNFDHTVADNNEEPSAPSSNKDVDTDILK